MVSRHRGMAWLVGALTVTTGFSCQGSASAAAPELRIELLAELPHDPRAFTQGLLWHGDVLYESTGLYGQSSLRQVDPITGEVLLQKDLGTALFGEGLARLGERLYQLTWREGSLLVYDLRTFALQNQLHYEGEGWGLASDGTHLWMSDGSSRLTIREPADFTVVRSLTVRLDEREVSQLNELEWAEGAIWANVWGEDRILRIDPTSGRVSGVADASGLLEPRLRARADVLNGIAYDPASKSFWLTGKLWPRIFQVRFRDPAKESAGR